MQTNETEQTPTDDTQQPPAEEAHLIPGFVPEQTPVAAEAQQPPNDGAEETQSWKDELRIPGVDVIPNA